MSDSKNNIHPADALKTLDQVLTVDPRNDHVELEDWHARIDEIKLTGSTPITVRQLFENAKNISLYSYFAYRLHQSAEAVAYSALEQALKLKYEQEKENLTLKREPRSLAALMDIALELGWITDEGYGSSRNLAASRVQMRLINKRIDEGAFEEGDSLPVPEPTEEEIVAEMRSMDVAKKRLHAGRHVRNFLAHGDHGLSATSIGTLANVAEEINQLFSG